MLLKDKTASSIKRKVQLAKQKVDKDATKAKKVLTLAEAEVDETYDTVQTLEDELASAMIAEGDAKEDLLLANKVARITVTKQGQVIDLISRFETDLDDLLNA